MEPSIQKMISNIIIILLIGVALFAAWVNNWGSSILIISFPTIIILLILLLISMSGFQSYLGKLDYGAEDLLRNSDEIVGKAIFVLLALTAIVASWSNDWNFFTLLLAFPTIVLSAILIFLDFERLKFFVYKKTGFEMIRPKQDSDLILTDGFDEFVDIASQESGSLALNLRRVQENSGSDDPFVSLSKIIEQKLDSNPIDEAIDELDHILEFKEYVLAEQRHNLRIISISEEDLIANCVGNGVKPVEGVTYELYAQIRITQRGETVEFEKVVAKAELVEISGDMYRLSTYEWNSGGDSNVNEIKDTLLDREPRLEVETRNLENIEWQDLEHAYNYLQRVSNSEVTDDA